MSRNMEWINSAQVGKDGFCRTLGFPALFAQDYYGAFDHFTQPALVDTTHYPGFVVTVIGGAGTIAMQDVVGGALGLVGGAADGKGVELQSIGECFLPAANKDIYAEARIKLTDCDDIDWLFGLATTDTSLFAGIPNEVIIFRGDDGDANIDFQVRSGGTGNAADTGYDTANATWVRLGFHVRGITSVTPYINGVALTPVTANIPATEMCLSFGALDGATTASNVMAIDWYRVLQFA